MTILPPLTDQEYEALKEVIEKIDAVEAIQGIPLRERDEEPMREMDLMRAQMRAAVEGYEAAHRQDLDKP